MKDACFLLPKGWNFDSHPMISVRRTAAMGDAISASVVCDRLIELGFRVTYAVHESFHPLMALHPGISKLENQKYIADVPLDGAYENDMRRTTHTFSELFIDRANQYLAHRGVRLAVKNCRPRLKVPAQAALMQRMFDPHLKPWVIIVPRASIQWKGRHVPNRIWEAAAKQIHGTCFWLGQDPAPAGIVDLKVNTIPMLPPVLANADLVASVDTGPMHLAAALGVPVVAILQNSSPALHLSDQADWTMVEPDLDCLNCQKNVCPKNATTPPCQQVPPELIAQEVNRKLHGLVKEEVSCVVPIYKPTAERVNRCVQAVLPQVSEVVITVDAGGTVPEGIKYYPNVRLVRAMRARIGVGPNMNHGARHTSGKYILLLNDDVVLKPDAVARMLECINTDVGMVGHLLYYPDGSIYHGGKYRPPGGLGWGHIDHRKFRPSITEPQETENVTGASILVRRNAFFDVNGFDERYFLYNEDDDLCMKFRYAGWQIMYTPHAIGIHEEGQSTRLIKDATGIMRESQRVFAQKWGRYFQHNKQEGLGDFNYA